MQNEIYFITGSSGSGKTTLLKSIGGCFDYSVSLHHIDDEDNLTLENLFTNSLNSGSQKLILEGSKKPTDVKLVASQNGVSKLKILLIDCGHEERKRRLIEDRKQPELDNLDIYAWAAYLRGQADALNIEVIDTTSSDIKESAGELFSSVKYFFQKSKK